MPRPERMDDRKARALIRRLQRDLPTLYPVRFERVAMKDWGDCGVITRGGRRYLSIRLADWLPWPADYLVLLHEYSHARAWKPDRLEVREKEDHGAEWGIRLAEVWRRAER